MKRKSIKKLLVLPILAASLILSACGNDSSTPDSGSGNNDTSHEVTNTDDKKQIIVGATEVPHADILDAIVSEVEGYELVVRRFTDYTQINQALHDGDLDANFFQHIPYLELSNNDFGFDLVDVLKVHIEPLGVYPGAVDSIDAIPDGGKISLPNDPSNQARALNLLADNGIIELSSTEDPSINDVSSNPKNISFVEMDAALLASTRQDVSVAVINTNFALEGGLNPNSDAIIIEAKDSPFANVIAVNRKDKDAAWVTALVNAIKSQKGKDFVAGLAESGIVSVLD